MIFEKQVVGAYKGMIHTRCDDTESVFYFSQENFAGLKAQSYIFNSSLIIIAISSMDFEASIMKNLSGSRFAI